MYIEDILGIDKLQIENRPSFTNSTERLNFTNNYDSLNYYIPKYSIEDLQNRYYTSFDTILENSGFYVDNENLYFIQNWGNLQFSYKQVDWSNTTTTKCNMLSTKVYIFNKESNKFTRQNLYSKCYSLTNLNVNAQIHQIQYVEYGEDYQYNEIIKVGTNYYDDLMYSNQTLNILGIASFLMIPILIVLWLVKVFRKGIH